MVVYDVTKHDSFDDVTSWLGEIEENRDQEDMMVYLVGNRVDLAEVGELRQVSLSEAVTLAREKRLDNVFETSAKTGFNVVELFQSLTKHLYLNNKSKLDQFRDEQYNNNGGLGHAGGTQENFTMSGIGGGFDGGNIGRGQSVTLKNGK